MNLRATVSVKGAIFEGKAPGIIRGECDAMLYKIVQFLERAVKARTPRGVYGANGGLIASIHGEVVDRGQPVSHGIIAHQSAYGDVIELGRSPGPISGDGYVSLQRWVEKKFNVSGDEAIQITTRIAHKIRQKGFRGHHMFERAFTEHFSYISRMADGAGFKIAARLTNE